MKAIQFKTKAMTAVLDNVPTEDEGRLIESTGKIKINQSIDVDSNIKKCSITIEWEEIIQNPCKDCPGFEYVNQK